MEKTHGTTQYPVASPVESFIFHNRLFLTYSVSGFTYIPIKPISDLIGIDWRNVKKSITENDNEIFYGTKRILVPKIDNSGGDITPQTELKSESQNDLESDNQQITQLVELLCIRFDRVHMFLARVNTSKVRSHGNIETADYLFELQNEWADALHNYESHGVAVNKAVFDNTKQLKVLVDIYSKLNDKQQKLVISKQIDHALGVHRSDNGDKQLDMLNQGGAAL